MLLVGLGLALLLTGCGPFVSNATQYDHATVAAGPPGAVISERFVAPCDGLTAIDLRVARYPAMSDADDRLALSLARVGPTGPTIIANATFDASSLQPNAWIRFAFAPVAGQQGQPLVLTARPTGAVTLWADGAAADASLQRFVGEEAAPGVLVARMACDVPPLALANQTLGRVAGDGWLWPVELGLAIVPGLVVALWLAEAGRDPLWLLGRGVSWSVLLAPLTLAVLTPLRAGQAGGIILLVAGAVGIAARWRAYRKRVGPGRTTSKTAPEVLALVALAAVGGFTLRVAQARELPLPLWVDSPQHSYVVGRILAEGGVPATYGPLMPPQVFDYHFGFQALAAFGAWLTGAGPGISVLAAGQILSALFCFAVYALIRDLAGSPLAAAVGALLVALVTTYPTYFVTWGRYPELAGLVALPAGYASLQALSHSGWRKRDFGAAALASIATILVHPRVAIFLAALLGAVFLAHLARRSLSAGGVFRVLAAGALGMVLGLPWLARLWTAHHALTVSSGVVASSAPLDFPLDLVFVGNDRILIGLAGVALLMAMIRHRNLAITIIAWCALAFLAANLNRLGLPIYLWLNGNSIAIAAFLPVVILVGSLADDLAAVIGSLTRPRPARLGVALLIGVLALSRWPGMLTLVNPCCDLVGPGDLSAIAWIRVHTPKTARFIVNDYLWQGNVWAGSDAGSWLPVLADRATTMPPMFYAVGPAGQVQRVDDQARFLASTTNPVALAGAARCLGARYVFIGAKGGPLDPSQLVASGLYEVDYRAGGAWVLELTGGGATSATDTSCIPTAGETPSSAKAAGLRSTTRG